MFESFFSTKSPLLYPMFAQVILTYSVLIITFVIRVKYVRSGKLSLKYFQTYDGEAPPKIIAQSSRQFINLFEIPVLFFIACLALMFRGIDSELSLWVAWFFVFARFLQAVIHLTANNIYWRLMAYVSGLIANFYLWILAVF